MHVFDLVNWTVLVLLEFQHSLHAVFDERYIHFVCEFGRDLSTNGFSVCHRLTI